MIALDMAGTLNTQLVKALFRKAKIVLVIVVFLILGAKGKKE